MSCKEFRETLIDAFLILLLVTCIAGIIVMVTR